MIVLLAINRAQILVTVLCVEDQSYMLCNVVVVVDNLVAPLILGVDFLQKHGVVLDFTKPSVMVCKTTAVSNTNARMAPVLPIYEAARKMVGRACAMSNIEEPGTDVVDECAVPMYHKPASVKFPECPRPIVSQQLYTNFKNNASV